MKFFIFDSLSRTKKEFVPIDPKKIRIYACGPTVYDYAHVGNARMAVVTDLLVRTLRKKYDNVIFVSNITDIDDKIINASKESGIPISNLTSKFHKIYNDEMLSLNVKLPDIQPKASEHINEMILMIEEIISKGCAYLAKDHVIFKVESYKHYGKLSGRSIEEQIAGSRVEVADYKKNPRDFVLWKPSKDNEPGWNSPWGRGRPGWHIECSAMSHKCLDTPFDIHCGGVDLTFPHHENEIAQSCSAQKVNCKPENFCKYWFHNGFVTSNGEKMSKSLGNIKLVNEILKKYSGEVIRLSLLTAHYRQPLNWTETILKQSETTLVRIYKNLEKIDSNDLEKSEINDNEYFLEFKDSLFDDLNTPKSLGILNKLLNLLNNSNKNNKVLIYNAIIEAIDFLGLNKKLKKYNKENIDSINKLVEERDLARKKKDFKRADEIRKKLSEINIEIEDTETGTKWTKLK